MSWSGELLSAAVLEVIGDEGEDGFVAARGPLRPMPHPVRATQMHADEIARRSFVEIISGTSLRLDSPYFAGCLDCRSR